jgi:hypothetical protein
MISNNEHPKDEQQTLDYGPALDGFAQVEAAYQQSIQGKDVGPVAARASYWCTFTGDYHAKGLDRLFVNGKPIFSGDPGTYNFSGTLEGIGVTIGGILSGYGRFSRNPAEIPSQVWCSAVATIPGPVLPNFVATFYHGDEYLGEVLCWAIGLGVGFRVSGFVNWRKS